MNEDLSTQGVIRRPGHQDTTLSTGSERCWHMPAYPTRRGLATRCVRLVSEWASSRVGNTNHLSNSKPASSRSSPPTIQESGYSLKASRKPCESCLAGLKVGSGRRPPPSRAEPRLGPRCERASGMVGVAYAVRTAANRGSELLIFVRGADYTGSQGRRGHGPDGFVARRSSASG
jgi:hypothetical protein